MPESHVIVWASTHLPAHRSAYLHQPEELLANINSVPYDQVGHTSRGTHYKEHYFVRHGR